MIFESAASSRPMVYWPEKRSGLPPSRPPRYVGYSSPGSLRRWVGQSAVQPAEAVVDGVVPLVVVLEDDLVNVEEPVLAVERLEQLERVGRGQAARRRLAVHAFHRVLVRRVVLEVVDVAVEHVDAQQEARQHQQQHGHVAADEEQVGLAVVGPLFERGELLRRERLFGRLGRRIQIARRVLTHERGRHVVAARPTLAPRAREPPHAVPLDSASRRGYAPRRGRFRARRARSARRISNAPRRVKVEVSCGARRCARSARPPTTNWLPARARKRATRWRCA